MTSTLSRKKENKEGEVISDWISHPPLLQGLLVKSLSVAIQMTATKQFFPMELFIMLYKVVLNLESVGEILNCDHLNESY